MSAKVIMVQGTTSHAGKSVLAAALCRILHQEGLQVAPFKAQNMSLNSYITPDGGEIGRAQAVQAEAAKIVPSVDMNPILLKPEAMHRTQVVVLGTALRSAEAREYLSMRSQFWPVVTGALDRLRAHYDAVIIEGAGSPAEINLKDREIVNMRVARYAQSPVLLVADIDRGGVFASLVGTMVLLEPEEQALVTGFVINKLRGDPSLLTPGLELLRQRTGVPTLGVLPYFDDIHVPQEDSLGLEAAPSAGPAVLDIAVIRLPHIANFDDFDPLWRHPGVAVRYVSAIADLGTPDLVILPGSKTTVADLAWLRRQGLADAIIARHGQGTPVIGICGGFQMLGRRILDPEGVESEEPGVAGLGLLPVATVFVKTKETHRVEGRVIADRGLLRGCAGAPITGYEIHMGRTVVEEGAAPFRITVRSGRTEDAVDGALDAEGRTLGTYLHGLFHNRSLRLELLRSLAARKGTALPEVAEEPDPDKEYDKLADFVREHLDLRPVFRAVGLSG